MRLPIRDNNRIREAVAKLIRLEGVDRDDHLRVQGGDQFRTLRFCRADRAPAEQRPEALAWTYERMRQAGDEYAAINLDTYS